MQKQLLWIISVLCTQHVNTVREWVLLHGHVIVVLFPKSFKRWQITLAEHSLTTHRCSLFMRPCVNCAPNSSVCRSDSVALLFVIQCNSAESPEDRQTRLLQSRQFAERMGNSSHCSQRHCAQIADRWQYDKLASMHILLHFAYKELSCESLPSESRWLRRGGHLHIISLENRQTDKTDEQTNHGHWLHVSVGLAKARPNYVLVTNLTRVSTITGIAQEVPIDKPALLKLFTAMHSQQAPNGLPGGQVR